MTKYQLNMADNKARARFILGQVETMTPTVNKIKLKGF